jgi:hypothetical protein
MVFQTDSKIEQIRKHGCYFTCLGGAVERVSTKIVTMEILEKAYFEAIKQGCMNSNCYIADPVGVIQVYAKLMGVKMHAVFCYKWYKGGKKDLYVSDCAPNFFVSHFMLTEKGDGHFVETTGAGSVVFDPYPNNINSKHGEIKSVRCFYVRAN